MFGIGVGEILVLLVVALVVFGPKQLPEAAKQLGLFVHTLKQNANVLQQDLFGRHEMTEQVDKPKDKLEDKSGE